LIPLYDETADIACTITDAEVPARIALIEQMRASHTRLDRTEHGMVLHFAPDPSTEADLRQFAVDEKRCCEFWGFAVARTGDDLRLQWDAPPDAQGLIDRLEAFFDGDEPATALKGLL
jgi:hypothetical protein